MGNSSDEKTAKMKSIAIPGILFAVLLSACVPLTERYANKLARNELLSKHADYFRSEYAGSKKNEPYWGYRAILEGELLVQLYDNVVEAITVGKHRRDIVSCMKLVKEVLFAHLGNYSTIWSEAIDDHVWGGSLYVDFSTALAITKKEYARLGIFSRINKIREAIKKQLSTFDKHKYPKTYELYAILCQLMYLAEQPKGSLISFNSTVHNLSNDFSKALALAELEF